MAIGPINAAAAAGATPRVEPVAEPSAVRQVINRLAAIAQAGLGVEAPQPPVSAEARLIQAVAAAVQAAAPRQGGLAPLMADFNQAVANLPPQAQAAVARVLALQTPLGPKVTGEQLQAATARSGLFLEAKMAAAAQPAPGGSKPPAPPMDLKAALLIAREALVRWAETAAPEADSAQAQAQAQAQARPAGPPPPPPLRHAPPAAQGQAAPSLPADAPPALAARRLVQETDAALARQELLQAASLPEGLQAGPRRLDSAGPHWLFEIPFTAPQGGQGVAQFAIEGDGAGERPGHTPVWRARFSLDIEPLGPLHAQVTLTGRRAGVTLWAERPESAALLRDWEGRLSEALEAADYLADVTMIGGAPPPPPATRAGALVDRSS
jgi:hypothetical protein